MLPITIVFAVSVTDRSYLSLPHDGLSLQYYRNLLSAAVAWLRASCAASLIAIASTAIAGDRRHALRHRLLAASAVAPAMPVRMLMLVPIIVPTIVYALGIYQAVGRICRLIDSFTGVIIAHAVTGHSLCGHHRLDRARGLRPKARAGRASTSAPASVQTLRLVIVPNILPGIISGAIFAFIHSWDELVIVLFIAGRSVFTLPRRIWDGINESLDPDHRPRSPPC